MIKKTVNGDANAIEIKSNQLKNVTVIIEGSYNSIIIEDDVIVKSYLNISISGNRIKVHIKKDTTFEGTDICVTEDDNFVIVGNDCMFALGTSIIASDYHSIIEPKTGKRTNFAKGVELKNHIWIASRAMILKNTTIGNGSIISAGAIVSGTFPDRVILGGVPANIKKKNIAWDRELLPYRDLIIPSTIKESNIEFYVEKYLTTNDSVLSGWAFLDKIDNLKSEFIFLVIDMNDQKHYYPGYKYKSDDVSKCYENSNYDYSRFKTFINIDENQIKSIILIIVNKNKGFSKTIYSNIEGKKQRTKKFLFLKRRSKYEK